MKKIYSAENLQAAYLIQGMLNEAGIPNRVFNEYAQGGLGELPFTHTYPEIWLAAESDEPRARAIIGQFENDPRSAHNAPCPKCRELNPLTFEICWQCGTPISAEHPEILGSDP